jgi:endonuclease/exonuclease/phosphatase family metal-dependent hydrolase
MKRILNFALIFKILTIFSLFALILSYISPFVHPNTIKFIPLFGLAYPIILLFNIILLIAWAFAKSKWFFYVLVFILIGGKLHLRVVGFTSDNQKIEGKNAIKILSYNVRLFDVYRVGFFQDYRNRDSIFNYLKKEQADIICFQEFYVQENRPKKIKFPTKDTLHTILNAPNFHSRMSFNKNFRNFFGVAMYSKYPMITKGHIDFEDSIHNTNNFCIFSDIVINSDTIRFYNTHFQSIQFQHDDYALFNEKQITGVSKSNILNLLQKLITAYQLRAEQALKVIEHMKQSPYEVVICGDFNDTPMSYIYNQFYTNYTDAFKNCSKGIGVTYAGKVPAGRIDYIFHSNTLETSNFKIQREIFSDHKSISCNLWKKKSKN